MAVHLLSCETRVASENGTSARDLRLRTLRPAMRVAAAAPSTLVVRELCGGRDWPKRDFGILKAQAVSEYATRVPPGDLLCFTDSDVLFNADADAPRKVWRRFEAARGEAGVVFMAEPWCFAPTMALMRRRGGERLVPATSCTTSILSLYEQTPQWQPARSWRCPRFLNSGAFCGVAAEVAKTARLGANDRAFRECVHRPREGTNDQCSYTEIMLRRNVSIALDVHERLFASGGIAVQAFETAKPLWTANSTHCSSCGRQRCRCSTLNDWRMPPSAGRAGRLRRKADYVDACKIDPHGPLAIHFNGVSKRLMKRGDMLAWIDAASKEGV